MTATVPDQSARKRRSFFFIARVTIFTGDHLVCVGVANVLLHHDLVDLVEEPLVLAAPFPPPATFWVAFSSTPFLSPPVRLVVVVAHPSARTFRRATPLPRNPYV